jgi:hypothetical protein
VGTTSARLHAAAASFWREWHRELRRHIGDERLPHPVRVRLRAWGDHALQHASAEEWQAIEPRWNRRAIAAAPPMRLSGDDEERARQLAAERGIRLDRRMVALEAGLRADLLRDAVTLLSREGYAVVSIGDPALPPPVTRCVLQASAFIICRSADLQRTAYETHTPSLRLDARDPFTAYPIRPDSVFTLATVVDLDTGRILPTDELLTAHYFRNTRNCGYRPSSAVDIEESVAEMIVGVRSGWADSAAQARFRRAVTDAGAALGSRVRHVVEWDAAGGFVGDGRLARVQAERAL